MFVLYNLFGRTFSVKNYFFFVSLIFVSFNCFSQFPPLITTTVFGLSSPCQLSPATYSIAAVEGARDYFWSFPFSWAGTSKINSITVIPNSNTGTISVTTTNLNGQIINARLALNVLDCNAPIIKYGLSGFEGDLNVYPNPNYGKLFIVYNDDMTLLTFSIFNVLGQEISSGNLAPNTRKEITLKCGRGFYILKINGPANYLILQKKVSVD